jgi:23S rRNA pseudouridine1911/1915/1917 synthase
MKQQDSAPHILYEDNHLLFAEKEAGLLTQPADGGKSLEDILKAFLKEKYQKRGNVFLHAVHRLDRPTSGIVLFAKSQKALARLNAMQREGLIRKEYLAICEGHIASGVLKHTLMHYSHHAQVVPEGTPGGKSATLSYEVLEVGKPGTLILVTLKTGRYHQIRAQMAASGHPILGDTKYGGAPFFPHSVIALHHFRMTVPHPITQKALTITSRPPIFWPMTIKDGFATMRDYS